MRPLFGSPNREAARTFDRARNGAGANRAGGRSRNGALMSRIVIGILALWVATLAVAQAQEGFDRPGGDYTSFAVRSGDPAACAARCDRDGRCKAWSFVYPSANTRGVCWLKNQVPNRVENPCCTSGVRGAGVIEPRDGKAEFGIDRTGGDYRGFDARVEPDGASCAATCTAEGRCRAWTYVRPGYIGPTARCFLKSRVTRPRKKPCCISGVVR